METLTSRVLLDGLVFPEGPRWHDGKLWFSDMHATKVMTVDPAGHAQEVVAVPELPSGLGFLPDGRLLIVSMRNRLLLRLDPEGLQTVADLSPLVSGDINDMVVDAQGRAYIGSFGFDLLGGAQPQPANLVLVSPDGSARVVAENLQFPNGAVMSPDGKTLIVAESFASRLTAFAVAPDGSLSGRRIFAELGERTPDGICLDAEGAVWVSSFSTDEFVRVTEGGRVTHRVPVAGKRAVACMLGGEGRQTLFLLTAETSIEELAQGKSAGYIETVQVEIPGAGLP
jgi:sugar lactone lactonase YvrE